MNKIYVITNFIIIIRLPSPPGNSFQFYSPASNDEKQKETNVHSKTNEITHYCYIHLFSIQCIFHSRNCLSPAAMLDNYIQQQQQISCRYAF